MRDIDPVCKIALVQAEPVLFDKEASLAKALDYIEESASQNPDVIVFPELFIPAIPSAWTSVLAWASGQKPAGPIGNAITTLPW